MYNGTIWAPAYQPELYHHGVKGQKWGVRRYQPYGPNDNGKGHFKGSSGQFSSALNRTERETAKFTYKKARAIRKMNTTKSDKKADKWEAKAKAYDSAIKKGRQDTARLIADAKKSGYSVKSRDVKTYQRTGRMVAVALIGGVPATGAMAGYDIYQGRQHGYESVGVVDSKTYSVRKNRRG